MSEVLKSLVEQRNQIVAQMRAIHETAEKETRSLNSDEDAKWGTLQTDLEAIDGRMMRARTISEITAPAPEELRVANKFIGKGQEPQPDADYRTLFTRWMRGGAASMNQEERSILVARADQSPEMRAAFSTDPGNAGGYTIPPEMRNQLEIALKAYGGMMEAAEIMTTDTGAQLSMPSFNMTTVKASIVGENVQSTALTASPFANVMLGAFTYRTPVLPLSYEFIQDTAFGEGYIIEAMRDFIGRALNEHFTNGTGTGQPRGILLDAVAGKVADTGNTTTFTFDDLFDLEHSIDPAYRRSGCRFMMHDTTFKTMKKIKDTNGRYIYMPGYDGMAGPIADTIMGYPVTINQDMPQPAVSAKSILFGVLSKYKVRMVRNVTLLRLVERYADFLQVGFLMFMRADGRLLDAGTNPVKYFQQSAT